MTWWRPAKIWLLTTFAEVLHRFLCEAEDTQSLVDVLAALDGDAVSA